MNHSEFGNGREAEAKKEQFRKEMNAKLAEFSKAGISTQDIATLLQGEDFLATTEVGKKQSPVLTFNAKGFIEHELNKNEFLKLPDTIRKTKETILPPDEGELRIGSGNGIEQKEIIHRSRFLMELLSEWNEPYQIISGTNILQT